MINEDDWVDHMLGLASTALGLSSTSSLTSLSQRAVRLRDAWCILPPDTTTGHYFYSAYTCGGCEAGPTGSFLAG